MSPAVSSWSPCAAGRSRELVYVSRSESRSHQVQMQGPAWRTCTLTLTGKIQQGIFQFQQPYLLQQCCIFLL